MSDKVCPGAANIKGTPTLEIKTCPACGSYVEMFSTDQEHTCSRCGFVIFNDLVSCRRWCRYAAKCFGEEA